MTRRIAVFGAILMSVAVALSACTSAQSELPDPGASVSHTPTDSASPSESATGDTSASPSEAPSDESSVSSSPTAQEETTPPPVQTPPASTVDCTQVACVALTFDDGPGPYTEQLLDELAARNAKATFFVLGTKAQAYPSIVAREAREGHSVGSHTWSHSQLTKLSPEQIAAEIDETSAAITAAGAPAPTLIRPPYGAKNADVMAAIGARGAQGVFWSIDSEDWKNKSVEVTTQRVLQAGPGSIVLMHDIHPSTIQAIPGIIDQLRAAGYTLVTVPEMFGSELSNYVGMQIYSQHQVR
ncbi:polysaccharide deacetylase family protein [Arcanobacterium haemolyticum]|nr:polysaccharide deacetylase family protein [Arcanobacterium haemolyticum]